MTTWSFQWTDSPSSSELSHIALGYSHIDSLLHLRSAVSWGVGEEVHIESLKGFVGEW